MWAGARGRVSDGLAPCYGQYVVVAVGNGSGKGDAFLITVCAPTMGLFTLRIELHIANEQ